MAEKKSDLRVKKTQRALILAMLELLEKTSFGKITVNDICEEAMVSRSTFYAHYQDKYALLKACMESLKERMFQESAELDFQGKLRQVLSNIKENVRVFRNLVMSELDVELMEMMRASFAQNIAQALAKRAEEGNAPTVPPEILATYYGAGITSVMHLWIGKDMPYTVEEMADYLMTLLMAILPDCK